MKRYCIQYLNKDSQHAKTTYCLGDSDLNATLVDLVVDGNFIDMVGEKDSEDTIGYYNSISVSDLLEDLGIADKNAINEDDAYNAWGM